MTAQLLRTAYLLLSVVLPISVYAQTSAPDIRSLSPFPKHAFERQGTFSLNATTVVVAADTGGTAAAVAWLREKILEATGTSLSLLPPEQYDGTAPAIVIGDARQPHIAELIDRYRPSGEPPLDSLGPPDITREAYLLDISTDHILVTAAGTDGLFHGVTTLLHLIGRAGLPRSITCCRILDYPDYPLRWVFSQHNLRGTGAMTVLRDILDSMRFHKINGIQQTDFKYAILAEQPDYYFDSVARFRGMAAERNLEIIPGVAPIGWSSGILWSDPHLAEGFPAEALYVVEGDSGRLIPDPHVALPNGGFEEVDGSERFTGWSFYDQETITVDRSVKRSGTASARGSNFSSHPAGNSRFNLQADCFPHRAYSTSVWVRTEDLQCDAVRLLAIGSNDAGESRVLTYTEFRVSGTSNGWQRLEARFNTLEFDRLLLYCGVWGGRSGTIWWDDWTIRDAGMLNILRREGTPLHVYDAASGAEYSEGSDFEPIIDPVMETSHGEFGPWHTPPTLHLTTQSRISNGDTLRVRWFHPLTTVADEQVNGSVMACVSEEKLYGILQDEIEGVDELYHPRHWFMGHDEIRSLNRDSACLSRNLSAADLLADNVRRITELIRASEPDARIAVWSDMFDSLHNAHADYYLVNGDLSGVWNNIPNDLHIVNWNSGRPQQSLDFFARHGFSQIVAPFLPSPDAASIRNWRVDCNDIPNIRGMMYTTWSRDYSQLRPFGHYSWSAGPCIIHRPFAVDEFRALTTTRDSIIFSAEVLDDPYDPGDRIERVHLTIEAPDLPGGTATYDLTGNDNIWRKEVPSGPLGSATRYRITAEDSRGLVRETYWYLLEDGVSSVEEHPVPRSDGPDLSSR